MSSGIACKCTGTRKERMTNWEVLQYKCNYSIFNGNRYTPSDYSCCHCTSCGMVWRTKQLYVDQLFHNIIKQTP